MCVWAGRVGGYNYAQEFLYEFLWHKGRGDALNLCRCGAADPLFRCTRCSRHRRLCQDCIVEDHTQSPLHIVEVSMIDFFHAHS